jgi:hypothetical protein
MSARFLGGEATFEFHQRFWIILGHNPIHYRLWQVESSKYPYIRMTLTSQSHKSSCRTPDSLMADATDDTSSAAVVEASAAV